MHGHGKLVVFWISTSLLNGHESTGIMLRDGELFLARGGSFIRELLNRDRAALTANAVRPWVSRELASRGTAHARCRSSADLLFILSSERRRWVDVDGILGKERWK